MSTISLQISLFDLDEAFGYMTNFAAKESVHYTHSPERI